jgi:hypothetical protein
VITLATNAFSNSLLSQSKSGLYFPNDVLDGSVGAEAQYVRETSAQWGSGDLPNLASGLEEANLSYPYLPTIPEEPGSSFSEGSYYWVKFI